MSHPDCYLTIYKNEIGRDKHINPQIYRIFGLTTAHFKPGGLFIANLQV